MLQRPSLHEALIHLMVVVSASDRNMTDAELSRIGQMIQTLPVFADFDQDRIIEVAGECQQILQNDDGLDSILNEVRDVVPASLYDTAYALAVEVAAADLHVEREEKRMLQLVRNRLRLDPLIAAAIERAAQARHRRPV